MVLTFPKYRDRIIDFPRQRVAFRHFGYNPEAATLSIVGVSAPLGFGVSACGSLQTLARSYGTVIQVNQPKVSLSIPVNRYQPCSRGMMINSSVDKRRSADLQEVGHRAYLRRIAEAQRSPVIPR